MSNEKGKQACGYKAAESIKSGMRVGIGTGSTVFFFIEKLIEMCKDGIQIEAAFSSERSRKQALGGGIPPIKDDLFTRLDITVDGADEIDPKNQMIKGGGGALFREKMLASSSDKVLIIVDESKCVKTLGSCKLPVEISPFAYTATIDKIHNLNLNGELRKDDKGSLYQTDGKNYIYDLHLTDPIADPQALHAKLITLPGVIETGLFFDLPTQLIVGRADGTIS